jgi:asparagine synthase (glutamine-hydrolysing)
VNSLEISLPNKELWHGSGTTYIRGYAFIGHRSISRDEFYHLLSSQESFEGFMQVLRQLNGSFAVVHRIGETLLVAEDCTRSFPLFYGSGSDGFYLSDDARWVRDQVEDSELDPVSASEFLLTGFVTGNDTLYPHVKQVGAGEIAVIRPVGSRVQVQHIRHCDCRHGNYLQKSAEELHVLLDEILVRVFERLIRFAHGRTMVVPLSGGYDSRLVVLMLKRLGYQNMIAFSYGRLGNVESRVSREVAKALGIRWEFVPYTKEAWSRWYHTEEYRRYRQMADGLASVPHIQDWPAVWELTRRQVVPKDSFFVPGHVTLGGAKMFPLSPSREIRMSQDHLIHLIYRDFYGLQDSSRQTEEIKRGIHMKIKNAVGDRSWYSLEGAADAYERWWWQERAAKFLLNSVRAYEYWGYDWWVPLRDTEVLDFWNRVPFVHRSRKSLHSSYVRKLERRITGQNIREYRPLWSMQPISFGVRVLLKTPLFRHVRRMLMLREYDRHPLAWWGILPRNAHRALCTGRGDINSFLALDTLRTLTLKPGSGQPAITRSTSSQNEG